ncbi:ZIP family metal transporter [Halovulum dunhuangense]|uniref:ZIP family metal transporter n=1 Tax=Halovulum dunhuangense TaxID=1505036 RepID=A0A849KXR5_9RHOB|nr:ZIP family metal transporter [Halovulum dunhuangense]NNU79437.1 ZIP family metal transporter [Halovulum dunhuangense]
MPADPVLLGFLAALAAGAMTAVGALPVLTGRGVSARGADAMLGFAAGVMLAASFFSLILPGLGHAADQAPGNRYWPATVAALGVLLGIVLLLALDRVLPHEHFQKGREGPVAQSLQRVWLFVLAITIHNIPEGAAVGVGFASGDIAKGMTLAAGIGLQNAPEGMAVALALSGLHFPPRLAFGIAAATGAVEPVAGLLGAWAVSLAAPLLPWGMMVAAGAMIGVIVQEIIPETQRRGHARQAMTGLGVGLSAMMFLDIAFG